MQLYFIRHGQSANNALWTVTGESGGRSYDPELTETGQSQASLVAQFLRQGDPALASRGTDPQNLTGFTITHVYCSLMVRAASTGHAIAEALDLPLYAWEEIHEAGGLYLDDEATGAQVGQIGHDRAYFQARYPRLVLPDKVDESGWWNRPYEQLEDRLPRAQRFLSQLRLRHSGTDHHVAIVSHGEFYNWFLGALLNLPVSNGMWFVLNNVAITRIDFDKDSATHAENLRLVYMNRVDFLPRNMVT
jgi:2,3-bisphosphoglycerate-dependent phosphoglycerate mutase